VTRVLIADDHAIVRRGVKEIITHEFEDVVCAEAEDGLKTLELVQNQVWDLLILDLSMPGRSGIDVLTTLQSMQIKLRVLVLSIHSEDQYAKRALMAGARGYMHKEGVPEELIKAVRKVLAGGLYVSAALAEKLAGDLNEQAGVPLHESLSDREFEILRMIASGKTVGQIAEQLHLAVTTVSTYRTRILEKTHKTTTAELIRYAMENHLVD
jgi:two-component system invasion response regulator UvrY